MPDVAAVRITNIVSVVRGTDTYKGVRSVDIIADKGVLAAILEEGDLYPTGSENLGTSGFPVTTRANFESDTAVMLTMMALGAGTDVITYKPAGGGANKAITIVNHEWRRQTTPLALGPVTSRFVTTSIEGQAYSADGTTLPISVA